MGIDFINVEFRKHVKVSGDLWLNRQELYKKLVQAKRPFDIFGEVEDLSGLKKKYLSFAKIIHPDTAKDFEQYISTLGFSILGELYTRGQRLVNQTEKSGNFLVNLDSNNFFYQIYWIY